jgi:hypothetical protein
LEQEGNGREGEKGLRGREDMLCSFGKRSERGNVRGKGEREGLV